MDDFKGSAYKYLNQLGLSNAHAPGFHELGDRPKTVLEPYCFSDSCCVTYKMVETPNGLRSRPRRLGKVLLTAIDPSATHCPRCRQSIVWRQRPATGPSKASGEGGAA